MTDFISKIEALRKIEAELDDLEHVMVIAITKTGQLTVISGDDQPVSSMAGLNVKTAMFIAAFEKVKLKLLGSATDMTHSVH